MPKEKPDGTKSWRPIGAPAYPDRMLLYLLQSFVVMFAAGYISDRQHAYLPGRGVVSATDELSRLLEDPQYRYVREFDLKGAFPSVNIYPAIALLKEIGFPPAFADYILNMSITTVERVDLAPPKKKGKLPEPKFDRQVKVMETVPAKFVAGDDLWTVDSVTRTDQLPEKYVSRERIQLHMKYASESEEMEMLGLLDDDFAFVSRHAGTPKVSPPELSSLPVGSVGLKAHSKVLSIAPLEGPKTEIQGFPQGSGLSPILFDIVFERGIIRHFKSLDPSCVVLAYADDFIVFSKKPLPESFKSSKVMLDLGLTFNWEKSHEVKAHGVWLREMLKFLGITYHFPDPTSSRILVQGTPKSGAILDYDKELTIEKFIVRDGCLREFSRLFNLALTPQELLDQWGQGKKPGSLVPLDVIRGDKILDTEKAQDLLTTVTALTGGMTLEEFCNQDKMEEVGTEDTDVSSGPKGARHRKGVKSLSRPLAGLQSRVKGLLVNRLHGGSWEAEVKPADRSLKPDRKTNGGSWIERIRHVAVKTPTLRGISEAAMHRVAARLEAFSARNRSISIYNSTSYATVDMMKILRNPRSIRLVKGGLRYS